MSDISNVGLIGLYNSFYALELRVADLGGGSGLFTSDISNVSLVGLYNSFNTLEERETLL